MTGAAAPSDIADRAELIKAAFSAGVGRSVRYNLSVDANAFTVEDEADAPQTSSVKGFAGLATNLLPLSDDLDLWDVAEPDEVTAATGITDAFGTETAWLLTTQGTINKSAIATQENVTLGAAATHTFSAYLKPNASDWCRLSVNDSGYGDVARCYFDVTNGTVGTGSDPDFVSAAMTLITNGFYRCELRFTGAAADFHFSVHAAEADGDTSFSTSVDATYVHGAQVEQSASAGTYLNTAASPVSVPIPINGGHLAGVI